MQQLAWQDNGVRCGFAQFAEYQCHTQWVFCAVRFSTVTTIRNNNASAVIHCVRNCLHGREAGTNKHYGQRITLW